MDDESLFSRAAKAGRILKSFLEDHAGRLRFGARNRDHLIKRIEAGEEPKGYRVDWVTTSANRVLHTLRDAATDFNARFPWDAASSEDMKDVLRTCLQNIENAETDPQEPL